MASISVAFSTLAVIMNFVCIVLAFDTSPLQDFCVADSTGKDDIIITSSIHKKSACKDPITVTPDDFFLSGLHLPGNTSNRYGAAAVTVSASTVPGLNGLGMTFMRIDLAQNGFFPPHYHPRATELVVVLEGSMEVGFITSYPNVKSYSKILKKGDVFVVPVGLVHNVQNLANGLTVAMVAFNSQNPGINNIPNGIFAAKPAIDSVYLSKAFQLDVKTIEDLQKKF